MKVWQGLARSLSLRALGPTGTVIGVALVVLVALALAIPLVSLARTPTAAAGARDDRILHRQFDHRDPRSKASVVSPTTSVPSAPALPSAPTAPSDPASPVSAPPPSSLPTSPATTTTLPATAPVPPFTWGPPVSVDAGSGTLAAVSCPSPTLCVATDTTGDVLTTTDPASANWTSANVAGPFALGTPSCPTTTLCVIADPGGVITSTNPAGGASAWLQTGLPGPPGGTQGAWWESVTCPSVSFCVAVGRSTIATSTNPSAGTAAWNVVSAPNDAVFSQPDLLNAVSCPITTFCVAVGALGMIYTSTDPTGGTKAWAGTEADTFAVQICSGCVNLANSLVGVACPSPALCLAIDPIGDVLTSSDPGDPSPAWTITALDDQWIPLNYVTCLSSTYCLAGPFFSSTPATGTGWTRTGFVYESSVSCPSVSTCVAVAGNQVTVGTYQG